MSDFKKKKSNGLYVISRRYGARHMLGILGKIFRLLFTCLFKRQVNAASKLQGVPYVMYDFVTGNC